MRWVTAEITLRDKPPLIGEKSEREQVEKRVR